MWPEVPEKPTRERMYVLHSNANEELNFAKKKLNKP